MMDYNWDMEKDIVSGFCEDQEELKRWIQRTILTERNTYPQYTSNYGVEIVHLMGLPATHNQMVLSNLFNTIYEALRVRDEILNVTDFQVNTNEEQKDSIVVTFHVHTIYGTFSQEFLLENLL